MWADKRYHSLDYEMKARYGHKIYKIALDGGFTCPNRDGHIDTRGCIFCSAGGSGDFAASRQLSITEQIEEGKQLLAGKRLSGKLEVGSKESPMPCYIAYFQAFTGTYDHIERLRSLYTEAIRRPEVAILSIATRPDCLSPEVLDLLSELNQLKACMDRGLVFRPFILIQRIIFGAVIHCQSMIQPSVSFMKEALRSSPTLFLAFPEKLLTTCRLPPIISLISLYRASSFSCFMFLKALTFIPTIWDSHFIHSHWMNIPISSSAVLS